jgi:hypothetical protein
MKCSALTLSFGIFLASLGLACTGCGSSPLSAGGSAEGSSGASAPDSSAVKVVMASGILQKCLGITPGADTMKMMHGPETQQACNQLPGADLYNQAGQSFQAGDHGAAAKIVTKAAEAGNAVAQLRLALMYDQGDGVPRSGTTAMRWYQRAAAQGEPESQVQLGIAYEAGDEGFPENWDLAAKLYEASARQGWRKGQFSFGRAYQFGMGVPQDRQQAIAWYQKAAANGDPNGKYWAQWLSDPTNNIGFRDDEERSIVMDVAGRMQFAVGSGDPAGVTFHNSAQRALWLGGERQRVNSEENEVFRKMRAADHAACMRAGPSSAADCP